MYCWNIILALGCQINRHHQPSKQWKGELQETETWATQFKARTVLSKWPAPGNKQLPGQETSIFREYMLATSYYSTCSPCNSKGSLTETCWEERGDKQNPWYLFMVRADGFLMHGWARSPGVVSLEPAGLFYQQTCGTSIQLSFSSSVVSICSKIQMDKWTQTKLAISLACEQRTDICFRATD